ncbi:acyltransferase [Sulfurovum sp. XGS-02]|uniref:acyltransferase family protein n=1 Tax=Sulfurovum sp. XGS-02 TaxID=2925411 RepID=UPI0020694CFD|nr:acyltransferase [Sulfurovum sp. XGS-02]UPT76871.1 acyltransferase [Sulfurovum sp. XGS-02]
MNIAPVLSNYLNFLRWIAAFLVVIGHLRSLIYPEYSQVINPSFLETIFYFITGLGHEAVIIFFVLSGYLVGGEFISMHKCKKQFYIYFIKRFSRIFTVFLPAIVIGGILDYIGITYLNTNGIYSNMYHFSAMNYSVIDRLSINTLIFNILMMQTSLSNTFGSNGPLWSLANEWWYYMLLPALYIIFNKNKIFLKATLFIVVLIMIFILNNNLLIYFSTWLLGALVFLFKKKFHFPFIIYISILLFLVSFIVSRINLFDSQFLHDLIISLSLAFLINNLAFINNTRIFFSKINSNLAKFSYSLYLFHFPLIVFVLAYSKETINHKLPLFICAIIITYLFSFIMYILFEKKTFLIKSKLYTFFNLTKEK